MSATEWSRRTQRDVVAALLDARRPIDRGSDRRENVSIGDEDDPGFVILSVDGTRAPLFIPTPERQAFAACSWERLAP